MKHFMIAAIAAIILAGFLAAGSPGSMKNLTVSYGFDQFPKEYTCDGTNVSPRIEVNGLSGMQNAASMAMILEDPDASKGTFTHWLIWNMQPANEVPGNIPPVMNVSSPIKAVQGTNGAGKIGYIGPCPPAGKPHRYFMRVYGLDRMLDVAPGSNESALESAMEGHIVAQGEGMATYGR